MNLADWYSQLEGARSADEVLLTVRAFLADLSPSEIKSLREDCRPSHIIDGEAVGRWAYTLTSAHCVKGSADENAALFKLSSFFARASQRLAALAHRPATLPPDER